MTLPVRLLLLTNDAAVRCSTQNKHVHLSVTEYYTQII